MGPRRLIRRSRRALKALLASVFAIAPFQAARPQVVCLDAHADILFAPSPDGAYALIGDKAASQLIMEDTRTRALRLVFGVTVQTMSVTWSPTSSAFVVNDRAASNWENGYLYNAQTLKRLDLRKLIVASDGRAATIVSNPNTSHSYVHAIRWADSDHVEVMLNGRADAHGTPEHVVPGRCFDLRYSVSLGGDVASISEQTLPADDCHDMDNSVYGEEHAPSAS